MNILFNAEDGNQTVERCVIKNSDDLDENWSCVDSIFTKID